MPLSTKKATKYGSSLLSHLYYIALPCFTSLLKTTNYADQLSTYGLVAQTIARSRLRREKLVEVGALGTSVPLQHLAVVALRDVEALIARRADQEAAVAVNNVELLELVRAALGPDLRCGVGVAVGDVEDAVPRVVEFEERLAVAQAPAVDVGDGVRAVVDLEAGAVPCPFGADAELVVAVDLEFLGLVYRRLRRCRERWWNG